VGVNMAFSIVKGSRRIEMSLLIFSNLRREEEVEGGSAMIQV
jgi:hypothetical protein